jgi:hypothetical protein
MGATSTQPAHAGRVPHEFVALQPGVQRRLLLRGKLGGYADLVFENQAHAQQLAAAEASSEPFRALVQLLLPLDPGCQQPGVQSYEQVRAYD